MMTRSGNSWSGKEVRVSIVYAVGGFPSALRRSKMAGYAANASSPLWFAQISTNVAAGCSCYPCLWGAGGGRGAVIGLAPPSLVSTGSRASGGVN